MHTVTNSQWKAAAGTALVATGIAAVVSAVIWARMLPLARATVWADDSTRFLGENVRLGLAGSLWIPYGGYLQFVPRVGGWVALHLGGFEDLARAATAVSCVVAGLVAALVFVLARPVTTTRVTPVLLGLSLAFVPALPAETAGNLANLHWFALVATPFLFAHRPTRWSSSVVLAVVTLAFTLSETQMVVFTPLLLVGIRDRRKLPIVVAAVVGLAAQFVTLASAPRTSRHPVALTISDIVQGFLVQPFAGTWTNDSAAVGAAITGVGWWVVVVPFLVVLLVVVFAMWRGRPVQRIMLGAMIWGSAVSWAAPLIVTPSPGFQFSRYTATDYGDFHVLRYTTIASTFIVLGLLLAADMVIRSRAGRIPAALVVLALLVSAVLNWHTPWTARMTGPAWAPQMPALRELCASAEPDTPIAVQVAPAQSWALTASCANLRP